MATDFRRFSDEVEEIAARWHGSAGMREGWSPVADYRGKTRDVFKPGFVDDGTGMRGYAKFRGRIQEPRDEVANFGLATEKIAADLGYELGMPVAPGTLWQPPNAAGRNDIGFISLNPFARDGGAAFDKVMTDLRRETGGDATQLNRQVIGQVGTQSSALWVYHAFTADLSEHNHSGDNMLLTDPRGTPRIASIDHGNADMGNWSIPNARKGMVDRTRHYQGPFTPEGSIGEYISNPTAKPRYDPETGTMRRDGPIDYDGKKLPPINLDKAAVAESLGRIEALSDSRLEAIIDRVPGRLLTDEAKQKVKDGLTAAAPKVQEFVSGFMDRFDRQYPNGWQPAANDAAGGKEVGGIDLPGWRAQNEAKRSLGADAGTGPSGPAPELPGTKLG